MKLKVYKIAAMALIGLAAFGSKGHAQQSPAAPSPQTPATAQLAPEPAVATTPSVYYYNNGALSSLSSLGDMNILQDSAYRKKMQKLQEQMHDLQRQMSTLRTEELKKNGVEADYYSKFGDTYGKWIDPLEIPEDVSFRVEEDSHQPRTGEDVKNDSVAAINLGWGSGRLSPQADEQLGKVFRMPPGAEGYKDWATKAEFRLDAIKEIIGQVEQAMQAGAPVSTNPVLMVIQMAKAMPQPVDHNPMMQRFYLEEVYLSDEFDKGSQLFQAVIIQLIQLHQAADEGEKGRRGEEVKR
jgi:hypothetical protein